MTPTVCVPSSWKKEGLALIQINLGNVLWYNNRIKGENYGSCHSFLPSVTFLCKCHLIIYSAHLAMVH